jgi:carbamoyltransferase
MERSRVKALGLHFGHDASGAVLDQGGLIRFLNKERTSRVKHALGLSTEDVASLISDLDEDGYVGLSSTQEVPLFHSSEIILEIEKGEDWSAAEFFGRLPPEHPYHRFRAWRPDHTDRGLVIRETEFPKETRLNAGFATSYDAMGMVNAQFPEFADEMHLNGSIAVGGKRFKARFYQHHFLHALYAAYSLSADKPALVITGDGGVGPYFFGGGIYFWTPGRKLQPITPVDGWLGSFYTLVSMALGFDEAGGPGKLMGLAPYGRPIYVDGAMIGTRTEVTSGGQTPLLDVMLNWLKRHNIDPSRLKEWKAFEEIPPPLVADVAASAQAILEINIQKLGGAAQSIARRAGFDFDAVLLCGGLALNCPANSNLWATMKRPVMVPPAVSDEGLSIGAAVAAYFDATGNYPAPPASFAEAVYLGGDVGADDIGEAASKFGWRLVPCGDCVLETANLLRAGNIVGICSGRSEVGPRALGHRSILADPCSTATWAAVNKLKRREPWRPFAPAVLKERAHAYFDRGPELSPYMLFNFRCTNKELPAVTHFDHTSRLQHVTAETGLLHRVLIAMETAGAPAVVLNTSFNGPGVPIVETALDAFEEANKIGLTRILTDFGLFEALGEALS